jgi:Icc-related predicted phosphoesterase
MNKPVVGVLRILVLSDLHGLHYKTASDLIDNMHPDWIVLCGDLLPDFAKIPGVGNRLQAQREFWQVYRRTFIREFAVTTLVRGNHEIEGFLDPSLCRLPAGLDGHVMRLEGVPAEFGTWGWTHEWEGGNCHVHVHVLGHPYGCDHGTGDEQAGDGPADKDNPVPRMVPSMWG